MHSIKSYSENQNLGLKIFHGVEVKEEKLHALTSIFETPDIQLESETVKKLFSKSIINLEADIVTVAKLQVIIFYIKF